MRYEIIRQNINILRRSFILQDAISGHTALYERDHSFSNYSQFSEKLTFLTPLIRTRTFAYQGFRNVSFSEKYFVSTK